MTRAAPSGVVTFLFTDIEGSTRSGLGDVGQPAGDAQHRSPALVPGASTAQPQLGCDRPCPLTRRTTAITHPSSDGPTRALNPSDGAGDAHDRLGQQPRIRRIGHRRLHHRRVGADLIGAHQLPGVALSSNASLSPATAASPHRPVSFINVVGCGTRVPNGIRLRNLIRTPWDARTQGHSWAVEPVRPGRRTRSEGQRATRRADCGCAIRCSISSPVGHG